MLVNLVNYAKAYAQKGFSVIPIGQNKRPLIKFADKPPLTVDKIDRVWQKFPLANIALKTDRFFVIDIDRHGEVDGLESVKNLHHNEWFKGTLSERTAHDGYHFYFLKPKDLEIKQNIGILPGVDLKAHKNNYVVCAPSRVGEKKYEWLNHNPILPAPLGLINLIKEKSKPVKHYDYSVNYGFDPNKKSRTTELFEMIANGLGDTGGRNNQLTELVGGLLLRKVDPLAVVKLSKIANNNTTDPLPEKEADTTIASVLESEARKREEGVNDEEEGWI